VYPAQKTIYAVGLHAQKMVWTGQNWVFLLDRKQFWTKNNSLCKHAKKLVLVLKNDIELHRKWSWTAQKIILDCSENGLGLHIKWS